MAKPSEILLSIDVSAATSGNFWKQGPGRRCTTHQDTFPYLHAIVMGCEGLFIRERNHSLEPKLEKYLKRAPTLEFQKSQLIIERQFPEFLLEGI